MDLKRLWLSVPMRLHMKTTAEPWWKKGADLIIGGGSWQAGDAITKVATEFPDKADYALIDSQVDVENVKCISYREQEGAYLIGKIAGMVTDDAA